jgi:hypothetical protein
MLAAQGDHDALDALVWRGQVATLFPAIEECRQRLLRELRGVLYAPYETGTGRVDRVVDLEIAHIADQLEDSRAPVARHYREPVQRLRRLRNQLAHLEVVDGEFLGEVLRDGVLSDG